MVGSFFGSGMGTLAAAIPSAGWQGSREPEIGKPTESATKDAVTEKYSWHRVV